MKFGPSDLYKFLEMRTGVLEKREKNCCAHELTENVGSFFSIGKKSLVPRCLREFAIGVTDRLF